MELTIKEVNEKLNLLRQLFTGKNDRFNYAIKKLDNNINKATKSKKEAFDEQVSDLREKFASTYQEGEKKGLYILDEKGAYLFTKEDTAKFNAEVRPLKRAFELEVVSIEPYFANENLDEVKQVDFFIKEELTGLLFRETERGEDICTETKSEEPKLQLVENEKSDSN